MKLSTIIVSFLIIATVYAGAIIQSIQGSSDSDNIKIEWLTGEETNLQKFVIERRTVNSSYIEIGTVSPRGNNSYYTFIDQNAYKTTNMFFKYRLKIVENNNEVSYSSEVNIEHSVSSVAKRTWGSIKAMFR